jgi:O-acetyl-ADP-ribose deacetylase (regulator of RNase III)
MMASSPIIPHIHLLCMNEKDTTAFKEAALELELPSSVQVTHHNNHLQGLDSSVKFNCIVSPANSYALMDGGFDDAITRAFSPDDNYYALTYYLQAEIYKQYRGYAPPGTATLIPIPAEYAEQSRTTDRWGCRWLALCPTMRVPYDANWDREVVYECIWTLMCALERHNRVARESGKSESAIDSILMTPLATGVGKVSGERWAHQAVLAMKHFISAVENPSKWGALDWNMVEDIDAAVTDTHQL